MKILNIQGMRKEVDEQGNPIPFQPTDKLKILKKYGEVFNPEVRYFSNPDLFQLTSDIIKRENVDCIVGHSAGGYLAFYLSNYFKIPSLIINPAIASNSLAPKLQICPPSYKSVPMYNKMLVVIGNRDFKKYGGVDFDLAINFFQKEGFFKIKTNKMFVEDGMFHGISLDLFEKYFKKFLSLYF